MIKIFIQENKGGPATRRQAKSSRGGYTIIETMIAISLFIIIVMMAMNSLLNANVVNNKSQKVRSIMDNLSFIMEDMSRNIRTGTTYVCIGQVPTPPLVAKSGLGCGGIAFKPVSGGSMWVYYVWNNGQTNGLYRQVDAGAPVKLTPDDVNITSSSVFDILGAEPPPDAQQPFVIIRLVGTVNSSPGVNSSFSLQTAVSERNIDI